MLDSTACRISEITKLNIYDINFDDKSIKITGKGNKQRIVYFSTRAKMYLEEYLKTRKGESNKLFLSDKKNISAYKRKSIAAYY